MARCPVCSKPFETRDDRGNGGRVQLYCSAPCKQRAWYLCKLSQPLTGRWVRRTYTSRIAA